jgi:hypothetical protein
MLSRRVVFRQSDFEQRARSAAREIAREDRRDATRLDNIR